MVTLRHTWKYLLAFYCLIMLWASLHEMIHHFSGWILCDFQFGYKTFNYFETACEGTRISLLATYTGPILNFAVMWWGASILRNGTTDLRRHLGFALIFAQLPLQRMLMPFFNGNDEYYASTQLFGDSIWIKIIVLILIWAACVPPLITAFKSIANKRRVLWFLWYLVLFPYLLWGPFFGGLEYLMVNRGVLDTTIIGMGALFVINEIITLAVWWRVRDWIRPEPAT